MTFSAPTTGSPTTGSRARGLRFAALGLGAVLGGALIGLVISIAMPAHVEIAGSGASVWMEPGRSYDEFGVPGLVSLKRATTRSLVGESVGVRVTLDIDVSQLTDADGRFVPEVLPAYIQAYSDPQQLVSDMRRALLTHVLWFVEGGAVVGALVFGGVLGYRRWRRAHDERAWPDGQRAVVLAYHQPERTALRRGVFAVLLVGVLAAVPSGQLHMPRDATIVGDPLFADGPLDGVEVDGLLRPALSAAESYIRTYFSDTDKYYDQLRDALDTQLEFSPVALPTGEDITSFGFVTDRHCNTGMDRVDVALLEHFGVKTLVSAGDDAFSGSFSFESACTRTLAERSRAAHITDVFAGGNHDSPESIAEEQKQHIKTLTGSPVVADGLTFLGSPDPRTSRYGEGIQPSSPLLQRRLVTQQGLAVGETACKLKGPVITVLHDPFAGLTALENGCGRATLALDGHTHVEQGPIAELLSDGTTGYRFTGGSAGGAPNEHSIEKNFAARLTVGPLNHDAYVYIVSVSRSTGQLVGITTFRFTSDQHIFIAQQLTG